MTKRLSHGKSDIERIFGFKSQKFTGINPIFSLLLGIVIFAIIYGILLCLRGFKPECPWIEMFFHGGSGNRSCIPYFTVFLSSWSLSILFIKNAKLKTQRKALTLEILPDDPNFVLTSTTAKDILNRINTLVAVPKDFILLDRISRALVNIKNIEDITALAECLNTQAQNDEDTLSNSYTVLKGFIWAIPVLGFIGTVLGLSEAVGGFGKVIREGVNDADSLINELGNVTGGLSIAFETTLIALVLALIIQLLMTLVLHKEELFLDECSDFCHKNLISKARNIQMSKE